MLHRPVVTDEIDAEDAAHAPARAARGLAAGLPGLHVLP
jgi:hypothetical protein